MKLNEIKEGDRILFKGRKEPLTVEEKGEDCIYIKGPQGGDYVIFEAPDDPDILLISNRGNREYSSLAENLREVGKWEKQGERVWRHSKTDAEISITDNDIGFHQIEVKGLDKSRLDLPKYGFSEMENAVEEAENIIKDYPEGGKSLEPEE